MGFLCAYLLMGFPFAYFLMDFVRLDIFYGFSCWKKNITPYIQLHFSFIFLWNTVHFVWCHNGIACEKIKHEVYRKLANISDHHMLRQCTLYSVVCIACIYRRFSLSSQSWWFFLLAVQHRKFDCYTCSLTFLNTLEMFVGHLLVKYFSFSLMSLDEDWWINLIITCCINMHRCMHRMCSLLAIIHITLHYCDIFFLLPHCHVSIRKEKRRKLARGKKKRATSACVTLRMLYIYS